MQVCDMKEIGKITNFGKILKALKDGFSQKSCRKWKHRSSTTVFRSDTYRSVRL